MQSLRRRDDVGAKMLQHEFGMVATCFLLDHRSASGGGKTGEQHRRLDLCGGDRGTVFDRQGIAGALQGERQPAALASRDHVRPHQDKRIEHPPHRPRAQRGVAVENGHDRATGHGSHDEAATGAGIAKIERFLGLPEAGDANAANGPGKFAGPIHPGAERTDRFGGIEDVFALKQAKDPAFADRERPQNQGAVRNRLVAGHPDFSDQGAGRS